MKTATEIEAECRASWLRHSLAAATYYQHKAAVAHACAADFTEWGHPHAIPWQEQAEKYHQYAARYVSDIFQFRC